MFPAKNTPLLGGQRTAAGGKSFKPSAGRGRSTLRSSTALPAAAEAEADAVAGGYGVDEDGGVYQTTAASGTAVHAEGSDIGGKEVNVESNWVHIRGPGSDPVVGGFLSWLSEVEGKEVEGGEELVFNPLSATDEDGDADEVEGAFLAADKSLTGGKPLAAYSAGDSLVPARGLRGGFEGRWDVEFGRQPGERLSSSPGVHSRRRLSSPIGPKVQGRIRASLCKHARLFCLPPVVQVSERATWYDTIRISCKCMMSHHW